MNFMKHYFKFLISSRDYLETNIFNVIKQGGLKKAYTCAINMCKWDNMNSEQRENWYLNEDRTMEF